MSDEDRKKEKGDYAEVEFEIGNIEFEAKGKSIVVERMFRLLLEKIEEGKLVATLRLPEEEEEESDSVDLEESELEEADEEEEPEGESKSDLEDTLKEIDDAVPSDDDPTESDIPSEAYLDPPPAWDTLDDESPPKSLVERESLDDSE